jgi:hypothetical protein
MVLVVIVGIGQVTDSLDKTINFAKLGLNKKTIN